MRSNIGKGSISFFVVDIIKIHANKTAEMLYPLFKTVYNKEFPDK